MDLDPLDATGKKEQVEERYKLNTWGLKALARDFLAWSGKKLTETELANFDGEKLLVGQRVTVILKRKKAGEESPPAVSKYLPATVAEQDSHN